MNTLPLLIFGNKSDLRPTTSEEIFNRLGLKDARKRSLGNILYEKLAVGASSRAKVIKGIPAGTTFLWRGPIQAQPSNAISTKNNNVMEGLMWLLNQLKKAN